MEKTSNSQKAQILVEALPYIQKYYGQKVVIKFGGSAMKDEEIKKTVMQDIVLLSQVGVKVILVHGGGPEINVMLDKLGIKSEFIDGFRKTDKATMDVVQMILAGKVGKDLVGLVQSFGGKAVGLCGIDGGMIKVKQKDPNLEYVGDILSVDTSLINQELDNGVIPIISTIGVDVDGNAYNINADTAAARIAGELKAIALFSMTDTAGLLKDMDDESTVISAVSVSEIPELIKEGVVSGGMIPKVTGSQEAIRRGAKHVFIIDGRKPHAIIIEMLTNEGMGTMFY